MSHYRYIQVDENGYIVSDNHSSDAVEAENMIPVALDLDFTKKRWNGESWEEYEPEAAPVFSPTKQEQIAIDTALTVEYIACLLEAGLQ